MNLLEALKTLDPKDDSLWTTDGLPRLDNLRLVTGRPLLSREELEVEASGFRRGLTLEETEVEVQGSVEEVLPDLVEEVEEEGTVEAHIGPNEELQALEAKIEKASTYIEDLRDEGTKLKELLISVQHERGKLEERRLALLPSDTPQDAIKAYLTRQKEIAADRAVQRAALKLLIPTSASPLDEALKRRR